MTATTFDAAATEAPARTAARKTDDSMAAVRAATLGLYLSLAFVFLWVGAMKFTAYEAANISGLILNSPLIGWVHSFGVQSASYLIGTVEITAGLLLAARLVSPRLSLLGAGLATLTLLVTVSFLFTTPGVAEPAAGGFPALSILPGQFLLKDVALLAIAVFCLIESRAARAR
jgi:uncharacterized membrane protein YkgB